MEALIAGLLALIAALLFYRFVERRHKILLARMLGILFLIALFVGSGVLWLQHSEERARQARADAEWSRGINAMSVSYLPESSQVNHASWSSLLFRVCNTSPDTIDAFHIEAQTWSIGRSTRLRIHNKLPYGQQLKSDVVLAPQACTHARFAGEFEVRDSVVAWASPTFRKPLP